MDQSAGSLCHSTYCYAELAASFINFLHHYSLSSGFYGAKDSRQVHGQYIWTPLHPAVSAPTSIIPQEGNCL